MARGNCAFKQTELARAARGAIAAGLCVQRIEVDKAGTISVVTAPSAAESLSTEAVASEADDVER
jgi:hypothetical protein